MAGSITHPTGDSETSAGLPAPKLSTKPNWGLSVEPAACELNKATLGSTNAEPESSEMLRVVSCQTGGTAGGVLDGEVVGVVEGEGTSEGLAEPVGDTPSSMDAVGLVDEVCETVGEWLGDAENDG